MKNKKNKIFTNLGFFGFLLFFCFVLVLCKVHMLPAIFSAFMVAFSTFHYFVACCSLLMCSRCHCWLYIFIVVFMINLIFKKLKTKYAKSKIFFKLKTISQQNLNNHQQKNWFERFFKCNIVILNEIFTS